MKKILLLITVGLVLGACGNEELKTDNGYERQKNSSDAEGKSIAPPQAYYDAALMNQFQTLDKQPTGKKSYLYLEFGETKVGKGFDGHKSFLVCEERATLAGSDLGAENNAEIFRAVQNYFQANLPSLEVVNTAPTSGDYTMIVITQSKDELGCGMAQSSNRGMAPFDIGNFNKNDVGFVFLETLDGNQDVAEEIIYQANQTFGINHDGTAVALSSQTLPGTDIIEGFSKLLTDIKDQEKVNISALLTPMDSVFPGGLGGIPGGVASLGQLSQVGGLGNIDAVITIFGLATGAAQNSPGLVNLDLNSVDVVKVIEVVGKVLIIFADPMAGGLQKLLSLVSLGGLTDVISIIQDVFAGLFGTKSSPLKLLPAEKLPDFSILLGLTKFSDVPNLLNGLTQHADLIKTKYSGQQATALLSMLKVGYAQAYSKLK